MHAEQARAIIWSWSGRRDLRDQDRVGRRGRRGGEIVRGPRRVEPVDADEHLARAEAAGLHGRDHLIARRGLGVGRDRILQIEDHAVGGQCLRLFERAGIRAGM